MPTDRQRVELMLAPIVLLDVVLNGISEPDGEEAMETRRLLRAAIEEVVADLREPQRSKIIRRSRRVYGDAVEPYRREGMEVAKLGLVAFYWLQNLVAQGYFVLAEDSLLQRALDRLLPALEPAANIPALDASAQRQAIRFLRGLQCAGYFAGVDFNDETAGAA